MPALPMTSPPRTPDAKFSYTEAAKTLRKSAVSPAEKLRLCKDLLGKPLYPPPHSLVLQHVLYVVDNELKNVEPAAKQKPLPLSELCEYWTLLQKLLTSPTSSYRVTASLQQSSQPVLQLAAHHLQHEPLQRPIAAVLLYFQQIIALPTVETYVLVLCAVARTNLKYDVLEQLATQLLRIINSVFLGEQDSRLLIKAVADISAALVPSKLSNKAERYLIPLLFLHGVSLSSVLEYLINQSPPHLPSIMEYILKGSARLLTDTRPFHLSAILATAMVIPHAHSELLGIFVTNITFRVAKKDDCLRLQSPVFQTMMQTVSQIFSAASQIGIIDHSIVQLDTRPLKKARIGAASRSDIQKLHPIHQLVLAISQLLRHMYSIDSFDHEQAAAASTALAEIASFSVEAVDPFIKDLLTACVRPHERKKNVSEDIPSRVLLVRVLLLSYAKARRLPDLFRSFVKAFPPAYASVFAKPLVRRALAGGVYNLRGVVVEECISCITPNTTKQFKSVPCLAVMLSVIVESTGPQGPRDLPEALGEFVLKCLSDQPRPASLQAPALQLLSSLLQVSGPIRMSFSDSFEKCCLLLAGNVPTEGHRKSKRVFHKQILNRLAQSTSQSVSDTFCFIRVLAALMQFYTRYLGCDDICDDKFIKKTCLLAFERFDCLRKECTVSEDHKLNFRHSSDQEVASIISYLPVLGAVSQFFDTVNGSGLSPGLQAFIGDAARAFDANRVLWEELLELNSIRASLPQCMDQLLFHSEKCKDSSLSAGCCNTQVFSLLKYLGLNLDEGDALRQSLGKLIKQDNVELYCCASAGIEAVHTRQMFICAEKRSRRKYDGGETKELTSTSDIGFGRVLKTMVSLVYGIYSRDAASLTRGSVTGHGKQDDGDAVHVLDKHDERTLANVCLNNLDVMANDDFVTGLYEMACRNGLLMARKTADMKEKLSNCDEKTVSVRHLNNQSTQQLIMLLSRITAFLSRTEKVSSEVEQVFLVACLQVCLKLICRAHVGRWGSARLLCSIVRRGSETGQVRVGKAANAVLSQIGNMVKRGGLTSEIGYSILGNCCQSISLTSHAAFRRVVEVGMAMVLNALSESTARRLLTELDDKSGDVLRQVREICNARIQYHGF